MNLEKKESFRPREEAEDKLTILALIEMLHDFVPEFPIERLVTAEPIQKHSRGRYTNETLISWAKELGIKNKSGRRPCSPAQRKNSVK